MFDSKKSKGANFYVIMPDCGRCSQNPEPGKYELPLLHQPKQPGEDWKDKKNPCGYECGGVSPRIAVLCNQCDDYNTPKCIDRQKQQQCLYIRGNGEYGVSQKVYNGGR